MPTELESLISRFLDLIHLGDKSLWLQAQCAHDALKTVKASTFASQVGCSSTRVRQLAKTFAAFPTEESRVALLPFSIHTLAAGTADPAHWLSLAEQNAWSTADMREAMRGKAPGDEAEACLAAGERIVQRLRRWGEGATVEARRAVAKAAVEWGRVNEA